MLQRSTRRIDCEDGFTLIELMVVVLIIGILIAIALPTFLGARQRAQDRAAQSDLRNAIVAARTIYTDNSTYVLATAANLPALETAISFVAGAPVAGTTSVGVMAVPTTAVWAAVRQSATGTCFYIADNAAVGITFGQTVQAVTLQCAAPTLALAPNGRWT